MDKLKLIGLYIGNLSIVNFRDLERKTYLGRDVVEIEFNDKSKQEYPVEDLKTIATKEPKDPTALRDVREMIVAQKVLGILADSEISISDPVRANIQHLLQTVILASIQESQDRAYGKLFGKDYYSITLADLDRVLKNEKEKKKNKDGTKPE